MSDDKKITAREAGVAVLKKVEEMLKGYKTENSSKIGVMPPHINQPQEEGDEAYETAPGKSKNKKRVKKQTDPRENDKEKAEGNNPAPGAEPFNVEKYQAADQKPGAKMGKSEMEALEKKAAWDKMVAKLKEEGHSQESAEKIAGSINAKYVHHYKKSEEEAAIASEEPKKSKKDQRLKDKLDVMGLKKDATSAIQGGIDAKTGGATGTNSAPINPAVASSMSSAFGKAEEGEKGCSQLARFMTHVSTKRGKKD